MLYVGIDPGAEGGIALLTGEGKVTLFKMPDTERGILAVVHGIRHRANVCGLIPQIILEQVGGYIPLREGTREEGYKHGGNPGSAMFKFGENYGGLRMALIACGFNEPKDWRTVTPAVWQHGLKVEVRGKSGEKAEHKRKLKALALSLFPDQRATLKTCDALLLAEYCRRNAARLFVD